VARHPALQPKVLTVAHDGDQRALHDDDAPAIDAHLHADLLSNSGIRRTYPAQLADLPEGAMVELDGRPWLVTQGQLLAWNPGGVISSSSFLTKCLCAGRPTTTAATSTTRHLCSQCGHE
jgi:hypothetical protein